MKFLEKVNNIVVEKIKSIPPKDRKTIVISTIVGVVIGVSITGFSSCSEESHDGIEVKVSKLESTIEEKDKEIEGLNTEVETLNAKVEEASPYFEMKEEEQKQLEKELAEQKAKEEEEKKKAEEEAKKKAEEEAKKGYDTGITYSQLARTPDDYLFEKVKFKGKVIQVMEGDDTVQIRLAVGGNYDQILLAEYDSSIVSSRVLEDDYITIMGVSYGLITYESTLGSNITIPSVVVDKIDQ